MDRKEYEQNIALGIFLRAHIFICRDKMSSIAIKNIEDNYYFHQAIIYERLHNVEYQEIFNYAAQLISQSDCADEAFSIYAEEYMKSFSKEKRQKQGVVYTPQEIVDWIHTKLEEQSPLSLHKTYCDFACGTGHFVLDWYTRLIKHWKHNRDKYPKIKDEHEAHRWIVEKCLYFADIDPFAIRMCKMGLFLKDPQVRGVRFSSFCGDSLLDEPFGNRKFDYVVGNPPYISLRNGGLSSAYKAKLKGLFSFYYGSGGDILNLFIELAKQRADFSGFVTSRYWLETPSLAPMRESLKNHIVNIWDHGNGESQFGSAFVMTACFIFNFTRIVTEPLGLNQTTIERLVLNNKSGWHLIHNSILTKLDLMPQLEVVADVSDGVYTGDVEVFLVSHQVAQELGINQKVVGGENVRKWYVSSERYLVPPCSQLEFEQQIIPVASYLKKHESRLLKRNCPPYEYRSNNQRWYNGKQGILARFYIDYKHYGFAAKGNVIGLNGNVFLIEPHDAKLNKTLLGILNSNVMEYWFHTRQKRRANNYMVTMSSYKRLPILSVDKMNDISGVLDPLVTKMLEDPTNQEIETRINEIVYKAFSLTEDEIKVIEDALNT